MGPSINALKNKKEPANNKAGLKGVQKKQNVKKRVNAAVKKQINAGAITKIKVKSGVKSESQSMNNSRTHAVEKKPLERNDDCTIFVGDLPEGTTKENLNQFFTKYGTIEEIRKSRPNKFSTNEKLGTNYAFIRFVKKGSASSALAANKTLFDESQEIRVCPAAEVAPKHDVEKSIYVGNIPYRIEEEPIRQLFADCGEIIGIHIIRFKNTSKVNKGYCYVNFANKVSIPSALKKNGQSLGNRNIRVLRALKMKDKKPQKTSKDLLGKQKSKAGNDSPVKRDVETLKTGPKNKNKAAAKKSPNKSLAGAEGMDETPPANGKLQTLSPKSTGGPKGANKTPAGAKRMDKTPPGSGKLQTPNSKSTGGPKGVNKTPKGAKGMNKTPTGKLHSPNKLSPAGPVGAKMTPSEKRNVMNKKRNSLPTPSTLTPKAKTMNISLSGNKTPNSLRSSAKNIKK